jgi:dihydroorotate dehydrogenase
VSSLYERLVRPRLFRSDPEDAHEQTMARLARWRLGGPLVEAFLAADDDRLAVELGPLRFRNPVGLAAGLDKHADAPHAWPWLGFGFYELGTVTPRPQPGNPRPRLFRLVEDEAIINRFGFNGPGADAVAAHLARAPERRADVPRGLNVGKNKDTAPENAAADHRACIERLRPFADYLVINVSSPNTPGLRLLQQPAFIRALVADAVDAARGVPLFVKIAPDWETPDALAETVGAIVEGGAFGIVATNTTLGREGLHGAIDEAGGLSGRPLTERANAVTRTIRRLVGPELPLIGVGGIMDTDDAAERLLAGADVVQIYTGLIYRGPTLPWAINHGLPEALMRQGFESLAGLRASRRAPAARSAAAAGAASRRA